MLLPLLMNVGMFAEQPVARGNAGAFLTDWEKQRRRRTDEDVARSRERFGVTQSVAEAIEEVVARHEEMDAQAMQEALRHELRMKRIQYRTKYLEALAERLQETVKSLNAEKQQRNAMILMLIAAAVT